MKKIISLFQRNYDTDRLVRDEIVPGAEWVPAGEGVATRKFDGTCCMVRDGVLLRRYDLKRGKKAPAGFEPAQEADPKTGNQPGWLPVGPGPEDQHHREAATAGPFRDGTYELIGPKVGGGAHGGANPERCDRHFLLYHGCERLLDAPRTFDELREYLATHDIEGIVWYHPDGRMVKIKGKDFGLQRPVVAETESMPV